MNKTTEQIQGIPQVEWIKYVEQFQWEEGLITFREAETLMLMLIQDGKMEVPA